MADFKTLFLEEARTQIDEWEESLLALEKTPDNPELVNRLLRAIHTLKGSAGFVECGELQALTHELESAILQGGDESPALSPGMLSVLFEALDSVRELIAAFSEGRIEEGMARDIRSRLEALALERTGPGTGGGAGTAPLYRIGIRIEAPVQERYLRSLLAQTRLEEVGTIITVRPSLEELRIRDAEFEYGVVIQTDKGAAELKNALNIDQVNVVEIRSYAPGEGEAARARPGCPDPDEPREGPARQLPKADDVVRVPASKLDAMLNLVGELVVQNSGFFSLSREIKSAYGSSPILARLDQRTETLSRIARLLQDTVMKVRMLPVAAVFSRFPRVVRDLAKASGKEIRLQVSGEETEMDKKIIDRLCEPLVHLVRNAVDHGIETAAERAAAGKDPAGLVSLRASQEGDRICVEVSDDGNGLDREKILAKALEKGIVKDSDAQKMSEDEVTGLIFLPGFSTAPAVTEISGRGVGLDVVKEFVQEMDGSLRVRSVKGMGTTMTISLPLTMAIVRAVLVEAASSVYAIPLSAVREIVVLPSSAYTSVLHDTVITLRKQVLSIVTLEQLLSGSSNDGSGFAPPRAEAPVVIVEHAGYTAGLVVGKVLGSSEVLIKSLGTHYLEVEGLLGASILGNGKLALILDVGALLDRHFANKRSGISVQEEPAARGDSAGPAAPSEDEPAAAPQMPAAPGLIDGIYSDGAAAASQAMTELLGEPVSVTFPEMRFIPLAEVTSRLGGDDAVIVRVYVELKGGITGCHVLVLPQEGALVLCDRLFQRPPHTTRSIGDDEFSGLSEVGNLLSASFINSFADALDIAVVSEVPDVRVDMCLPAIDAILARFQAPGSDILVTETEMIFGAAAQTVCHMLLFLESSSLAFVERSLSGIAAPGADGRDE